MALGETQMGGEQVSYQEAQDVREELTEAMRRTRRKGIKEANFLKGMR